MFSLLQRRKIRTSIKGYKLMMNKLTNKQIAARLYEEAAKPLDIDEGRAVFKIDGLTIRCGNTRNEIEAVAAKFHKNKSYKTRQPPNTGISQRKTPYKELSKLYADDPDQIQFSALFNPSVMQHIEAIS
jgi:hypothetical protein